MNEFEQRMRDCWRWGHNPLVKWVVAGHRLWLCCRCGRTLVGEDHPVSG